MLRKKLDKDAVKLKEIVPEVASKLSSEFRLKCALNGWKMLRQANEGINKEE